VKTKKPTMKDQFFYVSLRKLLFLLSLDEESSDKEDTNNDK
jgi:hypothetical protein